jgi:hypothetical protein
MKKSMLKTSAMVMSLAAMFSLAGCGSSSNDSASAKGSNTSQSEDAAPKWNKSDPDPLKNGNMKIAVEELKKHDALASIAENQDIVAVYKSPWDYYGKVIPFTGTVAIAENNPPDNNISKALGGESCEIVIQSGENIIVDGIISGNANSIQVGQQATIYGYPVGRTEVKNKMGGSFTHLVVVGKLH